MKCDCKICVYGTTLYTNEKDIDNRFNNNYRTYGKIACKKPSYGKRTFLVNEKAECGSYEKRYIKPVLRPHEEQN